MRRSDYQTFSDQAIAENMLRELQPIGDAACSIRSMMFWWLLAGAILGLLALLLRR